MKKYIAAFVAVANDCRVRSPQRRKRTAWRRPRASRLGRYCPPRTSRSPGHTTILEWRMGGTQRLWDGHGSGSAGGDRLR